MTLVSGGQIVKAESHRPATPFAADSIKAANPDAIFVRLLWKLLLIAKQARPLGSRCHYWRRWLGGRILLKVAGNAWMAPLRATLG
jgi:hypothetical protein